MYLVRITFIVLIASLSSVQAASLNDAMQDCAKIKRDLKRLACFDKLSGNVTSFATEQLTRTQATRISETSAQETTPNVATSPSSPEQGFGLRVKTASDNLEAIRSFIPGEFRGWAKGDEIRLGNGQIWEITDSRKFYHKATDPKVEITRGTLGSFRIKVVGLNRTAAVKRIK